MRLKNIFVILVLLISLPALAEAKVPKQLRAVFEETFAPAIPHEGLETAQADLELDKIRTFVVVEKGDVIPVDRAFYMFTPQEYDYRGGVVDGDRVDTRYGKIFTFLPKGTVMVLADDIYSGRHIYLKMLSLRIVPSSIHPKMKDSRVAVMLGFKFDKSVLENEDIDTVRSLVEVWVRPFSNLSEALRYSESLTAVSP